MRVRVRSHRRDFVGCRFGTGFIDDGWGGDEAYRMLSKLSDIAGRTAYNDHVRSSNANSFSDPTIYAAIG
jgi:hypothetical protein